MYTYTASVLQLEYTLHYTTLHYTCILASAVKVKKQNLRLD
jgi:hypothetical protein